MCAFSRLALIAAPDVLRYTLSHFQPPIPEIYQLEGTFASRVGHENGVVIFSDYFLYQRLWNY